MRLPLSPIPSLWLTPGVYLLPEHLTPDEIGATAELVAALLPGRPSIKFLHSDTDLEVGRSARDVVAVLDERAIRAAPSSVTDLRTLGYDYVLARLRGRHEDGSHWVERLLKPVTVSALRRALNAAAGSSSDNALAQAVLRRATAMTNDPVELVKLIERSLEGDPPQWKDQLERLAGRRLVERLERLPVDERSAAFSLVSSGGRGSPTDSMFRLGAEALQRIGLGEYTHGAFLLGPLAREVIASPLAQRELIERASRPAWSPRAVAMLDRSSLQHTPSGLNVERWGNVDVLVLSVLAAEHEAFVRVAASRPDVSVKRDPNGSVLVDFRAPASARGRGRRMGIVRLRGRGGFVSVSAAKDLIAQLRPGLLAFCGVCAGRKGHVEFQDVVVADRVIRYEARRSTEEREPRFESEMVYRLPSRLHELVARFNTSSQRPEGCHVRIGTLATGMQALRSPRAFETLALTHHNVIAVEMESEGLMAAAGEKALVVRGVSDLADDIERPHAVELAATAAASWLLGFVDAQLERALALG